MLADRPARSHPPGIRPCSLACLLRLLVAAAALAQPKPLAAAPAKTRLTWCCYMLLLLCALLPMARLDPEQLYLPKDFLPIVQRPWIPEHSLALVDGLRLPPPEPARAAPAPGRNDPCPCGSGKKHKRSCGA